MTAQKVCEVVRRVACVRIPSLQIQQPLLKSAQSVLSRQALAYAVRDDGIAFRLID